MTNKLPQPLQPDDFGTFYEALYGYAPFQWQQRLAELACHGDWPRYIKLPTSSGKTSCLDIAVFALAHQAWRRHETGVAIDTPRRIFFVVDRRIIVNEAYLRATHLVKELKAAVYRSDSPLFPVAWWLKNLAGNDHAPPLDCYELRGGVYRDDAGVRSLLQPTIVTSTVDQVGSRLLFRGYGVSDRNLPIHAALAANDSLILLDEAHCSKPFGQTMAAISRYRDAGLAPCAPARWSEEPLRTPFRFIEMTATPPAEVADADVFHLEDADYQADKQLDDRHGCAKPLRLEPSNAKGSRQNEMLAKHLVAQAKGLAEGSDGQPRCMRIAIVVNRVECARLAFEQLRDKEKYGARVELMIGRMRPIDRDQLTKRLQDQFKSGSETTLTDPHVVVATQCLEVGADFDFDGMVCQCASLDALRQRFGRLNRLGKSPHARGVIAMAEGDIAPRKLDPIYGDALPATWEWLQQHAQESVVDFGVRALDTTLTRSRQAAPDSLMKLAAPSVNAPVLMPAHVDLLCQTGPRPALEPAVAPYLHGPNRGVPEVRVCWRADLPVWRQGNDDVWLDQCHQTLAVCPPSSAECLSVPLPQFKAWLRGEEYERADDSGDTLGEEVTDESEAAKSKRQHVPSHRRGVVWNGRECQPASGRNAELDVVRPNALVVLPAIAGGWSSLGYIPNGPAEPDVQRDGKPAAFTDDELCQLARIDEASAAFYQARNRHIVRVHPRLITSSADRTALAGLWKFIDDESDWKHTVLAETEAESDVQPPGSTEPTELFVSGRAATLLATRAELASKPARQSPMVRYPGGFAVTGPRISTREQFPRASFDDDFDEHNLDANRRISLAEHLADVAAEAERLAESVGLEPALAKAIVTAAERHDLGKADLRFQALLLGSSLDMAAMQPKLWAKSDRGAGARQNVNGSTSRIPDADQLPRGFRHEMLSLGFAKQIDHDLDSDSCELMLHAIAAHHGHARPFAPVVIDETPPAADLRLLSPGSADKSNIALSVEQRLELPAHRLDSGISERFWQLNGRFGWWGLAWLETILRLADWVASAQPTNRPLRELQSAEATSTSTPYALHELTCAGLNGANPLGFLAAIGLFRHVACELDTATRLRWEVAGGNWSPTLIGPHAVLGDQAAFLDWLYESLRIDPEQHWLKRLNEMADERLGLVRPSEYSTASEGASWNDRIAAEWLSCNGSDLCDATSNNQLQTARRDYFPASAAAIVAALTRDHLERTLFRQWDYADPIQKVSLHLEPREDRRHAYQWHRPVGDPNRSLRGGMVGANRLAMDAWPLFQSIPVSGDLQTVGFQGTRPMKGIRWTWPLWCVPIRVCDVAAVLNLDAIQVGADEQSPASRNSLIARGIGTVFCLRRILVEKTPNFTAPVPVFTRRPSTDRPMRLRGH